MRIWVILHIVLVVGLLFACRKQIKKAVLRAWYTEDLAFTEFFYQPIAEEVYRFLRERKDTGDGWVSELQIMNHLHTLKKKWKYPPTIPEVERALLLMRERRSVTYDHSKMLYEGGGYQHKEGNIFEGSP